MVNLYMSYIRNVFLVTALLAVFFSALPDDVTCQESIESRKNAIIQDGLRLVYSAHYEKAIQQFRKLDEIDPESAEGIFFEAFVLELIMDVYRSQVFDDSLNAVTDRAIERAKNAVEENPSARNFMFLGGAYGVRGVRKGILGNWFGAYLDGRRAFKAMEETVKIDQTQYDCYYGIGSYHYWSTKKLRRFFFFLPDRREQGINELDLAIKRGVFAETPGQMALFRIYLEEKWYDKVVQLAESVLEKNPEHLFPRWYLGVALVRTEQWEKSRDNYQKIMEFIPKIEFRGIEADIEAAYYLGLSYYNLGELEKAKELIGTIPQYAGSVNTQLFYYDSYIKDSTDLLNEIEKKRASRQ
ncbi:tetratricopeptide repeat protein [candidate division KSB1 bacterium]